MQKLASIPIPHSSKIQHFVFGGLTTDQSYVSANERNSCPIQNSAWETKTPYDRCTDCGRLSGPGVNYPFSSQPVQ